MVTSETRVPTDSAGRYAKQLCNHASHMGARGEWTPPQGLVEFPHGGTLHLTATADELLLRANAGTHGDLAFIQDVIAADLGRFGHRNGMRVTWSSQTSKS